MNWILKRPSAQWSDFAVTENHLVIATVHTLKGEEAAIADGTLLAAAPALLEALVSCEAVLSLLQDAMPGEGPMQDIMAQGFTGSAIVRSRRAIALAKGETVTA